MRQLVLALGLVTVALAAWLAIQGQWWIALPDGLFGLGIAWIARLSLHEPHAPALAPSATPPAEASVPAAPASPPAPRPRPKRPHAA